LPRVVEVTTVVSFIFNKRLYSLGELLRLMDLINTITGRAAQGFDIKSATLQKQSLLQAMLE